MHFGCEACQSSSVLEGAARISSASAFSPHRKHMESHYFEEKAFVNGIRALIKEIPGSRLVPFSPWEDIARRWPPTNR